MQALIFGSIGTLEETSDLQRAAFNAAFRQHGLDWHRDRETYNGMLRASGGRDRIARQGCAASPVPARCRQEAASMAPLPFRPLWTSRPARMIRDHSNMTKDPPCP